MLKVSKILQRFTWWRDKAKKLHMHLAIDEIDNSSRETQLVKGLQKKKKKKSE